ncbi:MAG: 2-dehydropantoate 2-reductase [Gemmatimonadaceae bacterium]|nr:2-dehydropantoate 2-reductase [Gemmatimonadaceae bacterium]
MRIAIVGVGGVGGAFGARLAHAGHEVTFIARGATLAALRSSGLILESVDGDLHLPSVSATDDPSTVGPVDVVLVCVKSTQIEAIAPKLRPLIGPGTAVIPLQNGVEASALLAAVLGDGHVLEGLARLIAEQSAPGRISHTAVTPVMEFGARSATPANAPARAQIAPFAAALEEAGLHAVTPEHMDLALWEKFLFIDPFGTVGAATRVPIGVMRSVPETRALLDACVREVRAIGIGAGVALGDDAEARTWKRYDTLPPDSTASMQRDIMAQRPSELERQTGAVIRLGKQHGVPTPVHDVLYAVLRPSTMRPT